MKVYNTTFETMLRLLCLLDSTDFPLGAERILLMDFITTFGQKFHIAEDNLNGDNYANAAELAARRVRVQKTLKKMVQLSLKEKNEQTSAEMKESLFQMILSTEFPCQIIIAENDIPNIDYSEANMIHFTKDTETGHYGFLKEV